MPNKHLRTRNPSRGGYSYKYDNRRNWPAEDIQKDINLRLKYSCRLCGSKFKRILHPSSFLLPCGRCKFSSHLNGVKSNYDLVFGKYQCQERRCGQKWTQRLPFRSIVLNTPLCGHCNRRTKVSNVTFRGTMIGFKNSLLYKCQSCSKHKSLSIFQITQSGRDGLIRNSSESRDHSLPSNPSCDVCRTPMTFLRSQRKTFSAPSDFRYQFRPRSSSPKSRRPNTKNFDRKNRLPKSHGDSPKEQPYPQMYQDVTRQDINSQN